MYTSLFMLLGGCLVAQIPPDDGKRPLIWAADPNGGLPYIFKDKNDNFVGFEVDLKDALARELGRTIELKNPTYEFEHLFEGLDRKDFDFAMNGLEIIPRNLMQARFTRPYYAYQLQLVVRTGEQRFSNLTDAKKLNLTIGTLSGCAAEHMLDEKKIKKKPYEEQDLAFTDLKLGRTDGVLMDLPICLYYVATRPPLAKGKEPTDNFERYAKMISGLQFAGPPFAPGHYGIAVRKDNEVLAKQLDQALESLMRKGEVKRILQKWDLWNTDQLSIAPREQKSDKEASDTPTVEGAEVGGTDNRVREHPAFAKFIIPLWHGAIETVKITCVSMFFAVLLALPICACRMYGPGPLRWLAVMYVEFFRGIPVLFILYFLYFGLPGIYEQLNLTAEYVAVIAFALNYAAYEAEVYRAAIGAIPDGQWEAAASLGMTPPQTFWRIILPQSVRGILPPMTNDLVSLFKDTSLVSAIALADLNQEYRNLARDSGGYLPIALTTAALYLLMSVPLGFLSRYLEKRWGTK